MRTWGDANIGVVKSERRNVDMSICLRRGDGIESILDTARFLHLSVCTRTFPFENSKLGFEDDGVDGGEKQKNIKSNLRGVVRTVDIFLIVLILLPSAPCCYFSFVGGFPRSLVGACFPPAFVDDSNQSFLSDPMPATPVFRTVVCPRPC